MDRTKNSVRSRVYQNGKIFTLILFHISSTFFEIPQRRTTHMKDNRLVHALSCVKTSSNDVIITLWRHQVDCFLTAFFSSGEIFQINFSPLRKRFWGIVAAGLAIWWQSMLVANRPFFQMLQSKISYNAPVKSYTYNESAPFFASTFLKTQKTGGPYVSTSFKIMQFPAMCL